jgi:hypothetical protein
MNKKHIVIILFVLAVILIVCLGIFWKSRHEPLPLVPTPTEQTDPVVTIPTSLLYTNDIYGFAVTLPITWKGYTVTETTKDSQDGKYYEVHLVHPESTKENPRMDVPVLIVPIAIWNTWYPPADPESGHHPFAAPIPATERGRNTNYVFATAPRYNFSYLPGWEEVDEIVKTIKGLQ